MIVAHRMPRCLHYSEARIVGVEKVAYAISPAAIGVSHRRDDEQTQRQSESEVSAVIRSRSEPIKRRTVPAFDPIRPIVFFEELPPGVLRDLDDRTTMLAYGAQEVALLVEQQLADSKLEWRVAADPLQRRQRFPFRESTTTSVRAQTQQTDVESKGGKTTSGGTWYWPQPPSVLSRLRLTTRIVPFSSSLSVGAS